MTWNLETPEPPGTSEEACDAIDALELDGPAEAQEQLSVAKDAAKQLIESGAIGETGPDGAYFGAVFAGVANPGNVVPEEGPTDRITVEVRQVAYEPPAPPEEAAEEAEAIAAASDTPAGDSTAQREEVAAPA